MTSELENEYLSGLKKALEVGWSILEKGGTALDTVEATVVELENFPLFNAGKGSVFTHAGKNEMDASIMDGSSLQAGAVAFVKNIKNPIKLARLVMEWTIIFCSAARAPMNSRRKWKPYKNRTNISLPSTGISNCRKPWNTTGYNWIMQFGSRI